MTMAMAQTVAAGQAAAGTLTVDEAIEQIGTGRFQRRLLTVNGLTWAADAMEVLMIGFLIGPVAAAFNLARPQAA